MQIRPKAGQQLSSAFYAPHRDVAHVGPDLIRAACMALGEEYAEPWFLAFRAEHAVTDEALGKAAVMLAEACQRMLVGDNPVVVLEERGFTSLPAPVQLCLYSKMGQVFLAAIWGGVKDTTQLGAEVPERVQAILDTACSVMEEFAKKKDHDKTTGSGAEVVPAASPPADCGNCG